MGGVSGSATSIRAGADAVRRAGPGRPKQARPPKGWSMRLQTCLSRFGQATEVKRLASRGLQGLAHYTK